ncbi:MAG: hypothetical protein RSG56_11550 [Brevundimonas sp.]
MLKNKNSSAIVAVKDLDRAKAFYSDVLELNLADTSMEGMLGYRTGSTWHQSGQRRDLGRRRRAGRHRRGAEGQGRDLRAL